MPTSLGVISVYLAGSKTLLASWLCILALTMGGCASLPEDLQQVPSQGYGQPEQTFLGASSRKRMGARLMSWLTIEQEL